MGEVEIMNINLVFPVW